ncbi:hypothetical protein [Nocardia mexicana]|uniref:Uncharacterized protein n=1 Tax=Nocardia mexicana TaxID=279262 RepID=A0A370HBA3_9NOCA|nr:hypothetical protein [Nocardia mexicana]RDI51858.1 hypothetical protein DFR68_104342 [Nocardia mexicana]
MKKLAATLCLTVAATGLWPGVALASPDTGPAAPVPDSATSIAANPETEQRWNAELQRALPGAIVGGIIGGVIAFPLGGIILSPVTVVPGAIIGAGIGLLAVGGQPLIDAYTARFSEEPDAPADGSVAVPLAE